MNSSVGWNSLSMAGKLSPEQDILRNIEKSLVEGLPRWGREMLSDSEPTKYTHTHGASWAVCGSGVPPYDFLNVYGVLNSGFPNSFSWETARSKEPIGADEG